MSSNLPSLNPSSLARFIDHTLLKPDASETAIVRLCQEARDHCFASVCVNPFWVRLCAQLLEGANVATCTVVGFPLGANTPGTKLFEASEALASGAREIDMVQNVGALLSNQTNIVENEIASLATQAHQAGAILKAILETSLLTDSQIELACRIAADAGADFVKTSTGFSTAGATAAHVRLMRNTVGANIGVKASGGVRTLQSMLEMMDAGANRIGTSSGVAIVQAAATGESATLGSPAAY